MAEEEAPFVYHGGSSREIPRNVVYVKVADGVTAIAPGAFKSCGCLQIIQFSDTVTSIGESAFQYCAKLHTVLFGANLRSIGDYAFHSTTSLKSVELPNGLETIGNRAFVFSGLEGTLTIPNSVNHIGDHCFGSCIRLTKVILPKNNNQLIINQFAFEGCFNLEEIILPDHFTQLPLGIFSFCKKLHKIILPSNLHTICSAAFEYCCSLQEITIPDSVAFIGKEAFDCCSSLMKIHLPNRPEITVHPGCFRRCESIFKIKCPPLMAADQYASVLREVGPWDGEQIDVEREPAQWDLTRLDSNGFRTIYVSEDLDRRGRLALLPLYYRNCHRYIRMGSETRKADNPRLQPTLIYYHLRQKMQETWRAKGNAPPSGKRRSIMPDRASACISYPRN